jgi:hypothetical protein|tara:strand:- start:7628 stop:8329 length:702 start_codon:yes stop_codon:yes gene_type:complete
MKNYIKKLLKEEVENYMFFQNLKTIKHHVDMLLDKPTEEVDSILKKHDWASEHISTAKDDVEEVCNFFTHGQEIRESKDRTIKCSDCGWSWKESESEPDDLYNCHECGKDNSPKTNEAKGPCWDGYERVPNTKVGEKGSCRKKTNETITEAEFKGRKVKLNKPTRCRKGEEGCSKKFKVFVKDGDKVKKVQFGDPNMEIKKDNPKNRKSFRARHNCDNPGPKTKARYWSCKKW